MPSRRTIRRIERASDIFGFVVITLTLFAIGAHAVRFALRFACEVAA